MDYQTKPKMLVNRTGSTKSEQDLLTDIIHRAAHDIRSPLTVIKPYIDFLHKVEDKNQSAAILRNIKKSVVQIESILDHLVNVSDLILSGAQPCTVLSFEVLFERVKAKLSGVINPADLFNTEFSAAPSIIFPEPYLESIFFEVLNAILRNRPQQKDLIVYLSTETAAEGIVLSFQSMEPGADPPVVNDPSPDSLRKVMRESLELTKLEIIATKNGGRLEFDCGPGYYTTKILLKPYDAD